jgi:hypothetical protein
VRQARPHIAKAGEQTLLACTACSGCPGATTCTPLIVGGEVIGSVLADHAHPHDELEKRAIREAVTQAAPSSVTCETSPWPNGAPPPMASPVCPTSIGYTTPCGE